MIDFGKKVLVVAAHPDDEILGVGATIPMLAQQGADVTVVIVTDGSSTQYQCDSDILSTKHEEARRANDIAGTAHLLQWSHPDMRLDTVDHATLNQDFEALVQDGKFESIFVQHFDDMNMDHRIIYDSVAVVARPLPGQSVRNLLTYHVNSSTEWGGIARRVFEPNVYLNVEGTISKKLEAMKAYTTELRPYPHPRSLESIEDRAKVFGSEVGCRYAEAFRLILSKF
jgi:LmbE family N-acetylglucosaminyl deacetylase